MYEREQMSQGGNLPSNQSTEAFVSLRIGVNQAIDSRLRKYGTRIDLRRRIRFLFCSIQSFERPVLVGDRAPTRLILYGVTPCRLVASWIRAVSAGCLHHPDFM